MVHRFLPLLLLALAGCSTLLPSGSTDTPAGFASFEEARAAVERIAPFRTRTSELQSMGFDTREGRNVTLVPYPDIMGRLAPYQGMPLSQLDPGVARCIQAQAACRGWVFHFERQDRKREGSFWLDFLNIRRVTNVRGWWFDALIVESEGTVLFRSSGGQARTDRVEKQFNPLGPFQPAGEGAATVLIH
ncbi:hypothetical protein [Caenimonas aquaedulcis]|uniref:Lipoprotein n=1 Tax=Caenimonas aquaedulcis TaxID=2793270 RepID=A0A931H8D1_9BURK|nr:hypothetical protein [Caenimonas aquaedulcis]MBG9390210.1 hypothetical protein [Caenimonas aquaedulcis]